MQIVEFLLVVGLGFAPAGDLIALALQGKLFGLDVIVELFHRLLGHRVRPFDAAAADRVTSLGEQYEDESTATIGRPARSEKRPKSEARPSEMFQRCGLLGGGGDTARLPSGTTNHSLHAGHWIRCPKCASLTWSRWPFGQVVSKGIPKLRNRGGDGSFFQVRPLVYFYRTAPPAIHGYSQFARFEGVWSNADRSYKIIS